MANKPKPNTLVVGGKTFMLSSGSSNVAPKTTKPKSDAAKLIKPGKTTLTKRQKEMQKAMDKKMASRSKSGNWGRGTI